MAPPTFDEMDGREQARWRKNQSESRRRSSASSRAAHRRLEEVQKRIEAQQAAGVETLAERSKRILDEARAREAARAAAAAGQGGARGGGGAPAAGRDGGDGRRRARSGPAPPVGAVSAGGARVAGVRPLDWLDEITSKYKLPTRAKRCATCSSSPTASRRRQEADLPVGALPPATPARARQATASEEAQADGGSGFQALWLEAVMWSGHPTIEKTVRIVVDYYRK